MSTTHYTPREGSGPARVIARLKEHGGSLPRKAVAELLDVPASNVGAILAAAISHGALVRDTDGFRLPLGTATQPVADLQQAWGIGAKPAFPSTPPRADDPPPSTPRKMRTLKDVAIKPPPAPTTALTNHSAEPASLRQIGGTHYKQMAVQPWDVVDNWPLEQRIGYYRGNALKYLMRMGSKDQDAQEIGKGLHYIEKLLEVLQEHDVQLAAT